MNYPAQINQIPHNLIFNKSAIARILGIPPSQITEWEERGNRLINISLKGNAIKRLGCTCTLTAKQLEDEFHRYRMEAGAELEAFHAGESRYGDRWDVRSSRGDIYQVEIVDGHYRCICEDWHQHQTRCKHGWAVHFSLEATKKLSCHDCSYWNFSHGGYCQMRAQADLDQLPITHAEICKLMIVDFEEF